MVPSREVVAGTRAPMEGRERKARPTVRAVRMLSRDEEVFLRGSRVVIMEGMERADWEVANSIAASGTDWLR